MRAAIIATGLFLLGLSTEAGLASPKAVRASIIDGDLSPVIGPMGNVKVTFSDGHSELWTREGHAMLAGVSIQGLVGWAVVTADNNRGMHLDNVLRVCWPDGHHRDFAVDMPFIENWKFSHNGATVVLQFRGTHGPENYVEYDLSSGDRLNEANAVVNDATPSWAHPLDE